MIQNPFRHKLIMKNHKYTKDAVHGIIGKKQGILPLAPCNYHQFSFFHLFVTSCLSLRPLRLCGELILLLFFVFIISCPTLLFAEEHLEKTETPPSQTNKEDAWTGIDVSIVGKYATKYGRPPRDPYINTDQGDLLLFVFTIAGVIGGFIIGFNVRKIFYEK